MKLFLFLSFSTVGNTNKSSSCMKAIASTKIVDTQTDSESVREGKKRERFLRVSSIQPIYQWIGATATCMLARFRSTSIPIQRPQSHTNWQRGLTLREHIQTHTPKCHTIPNDGRVDNVARLVSWRRQPNNHFVRHSFSLLLQHSFPKLL